MGVDSRLVTTAVLVSRPRLQKGLFCHVAACRAARLPVLGAFITAEVVVAFIEDLIPTWRADRRMAAVYATDTARSCAKWSHSVAGTSSIHAGSRFECALHTLFVWVL
jgi:hypothetical protein